MAGFRAGAAAVLTVLALGGAAVAASEKALVSAQPSVPSPERPAPSPSPPPSRPAPPGVAPQAGPPPAVPVPPAPGTVPCRPDARVCVQLATSQAWLRPARGAVLGPVPVRHGRPDSPTPVGAWPVERKNGAHVNSVDGSPMPFAVFFRGDLALYEADLARPSAGSVRLARGAAQQFFAGAEVGDVVEVVP